MKNMEYHMKYHVTCNTDNNYAQHCVVMLCSLFDNNKGLDFCVHILINDLSEENKKAIIDLSKQYGNEIIFHMVDESLLEDLQYRKHRPLTKAAYYRVLLPSILDESIERVLYLDCDMIVLRDISDLYRIDISEYALAATSDVTPWTSEHRLQLNLSMQDKAFCSGIMMINLKYWREHNAQNKLIEFSRTKREPVYLHDQDALNYVFRNQWFELPPKWNHTPLSVSVGAAKWFDNEEYAFNPCIMHYSGDLKPWYNVWFPEKKYYVKYILLSGYPATIINKDIKFRIYGIIFVFRYFMSRFIYPILPEFLEILFRDTFFTIKLVLTLLINPRGLKKLILNRWEIKHR